MKQFFAKYLPVEGEAQDIGDCFEIEKNSICKIIGNTNSNYRFKTIGLTGFFKDKKGDYNLIGNHKKVKLFLCSRDIQIGDKVLDQDNDEGIVKDCSDLHNIHIEYINGGSSLICNLANCIDKEQEGIQYCFKVIGELSPKAIWIKEGDEFDDMDWAQFLTYWDMDENGECNPKELDEEELEWKIDYGYQYEPYIRVKCSQCEIYH